jgi:hypothetical protein
MGPNMRGMHHLELRVTTIDEKTPPVNRMLDRLYRLSKGLCVFEDVIEVRDHFEMRTYSSGDV